MRILHTSDLHLGLDLHGISMLNEQEHFINNLPEIIKENNIDTVIIAGDIYDNSVSKSSAISLYNSLAEKICVDLNMPLFIIAGNHDGAARLSSLKALLAKSNLYVTGKLTKEISPIIMGDTAIYSIPYFNIDEVKALYPDKEIKNYQEAFKTVVENIKIDKAFTNIAVAHAFVSGASLSDSDTAAIIGSASMISSEIFKDFDYTALGHLHGPQSIGKNCRYSGSPIKYSFSEANHNKSVTVFDTATKKIEEIYLKPLNEMQIIKGNYADIIDLTEQNNSYLKLEITDMPLGFEMLEILKSNFPNLLTVSGKAFEQEQEISVTAEALKAMTPTEILESFFAEIYGENLSNEQTGMFCDALLQAEKGDDIQ